MHNCVFCSIVHAELPALKVYEDKEFLAIQDIHPQAPVHFLIMCKQHIPSLAACQNTDALLLGKMMLLAANLARDEGSPEGFRTIINTGRIGRQEIEHLHIHLLGGSEPLPLMMGR